MEDQIGSLHTVNKVGFLQYKGVTCQGATMKPPGTGLNHSRPPLLVKQKIQG